jgi:adenosylcobinamide kinase/adenosylcobinamide-phosphate guanylyltransferase
MTVPAAHCVLVTGGARSGKSLYAEALIRDSRLAPVYVATCTPHDAEMEERVARHRLQRGDGWATIEEQRAIADVIARESAAGRAILVDCLTLWLSNLMFSEKDIPAETARLIEAIKALAGPCVFVSNEVGMGIVPENRLSRSFRDAQGRLNQDIASVCHQVVFVAAGQPLLLKPSHQPEIGL